AWDGDEYQANIDAKAADGRSMHGEVDFLERFAPTTVLDAGTYDSYTWSTGATTQQIVVSTEGLYRVTVTDPNGCTGSDDLFVTVNPAPSPVISGDTSICTGESTMLDAGVFAQYAWSTGASTQIITVNSGGIVALTVTDGNGCTGTDQIVVEEFAPPVPAITGPAEFCSGSTVSLDAGNYEVYQWSTGQSTPSITVGTPGDYGVTVTDVNGCTGEDEVFVEEIIVVATITGQLSICTGSTTLLDAGSFAGYAWSTGESTATIEVSEGGFYAVTVTDVNGCTATDQVEVIENDNLVPQISGPEVLCEGSSVTLDAGVFDSYQWSTGASTQTIVVFSSGDYGVTVSDINGCTGDDVVTMTEVPAPDPAISGDQTFCDGASTVLDAGTYAAWAWSEGSAQQTIEVFDAGIYTVTVTDENGCTGTDEVLTEVLPAPLVQIFGEPTFCPGDTTILSVDPFDSYQWSTGATTQSIEISEPGDYFITVTDMNGCTNTQEAIVSELPTPAPEIQGATSFCTGGNTQLDAGNYATYLWSTGDTSQIILVTQSGEVRVTVTDQQGCEGTDSVLIQEVPALMPDIQGSTELCNGLSTVLDAGVFDAYSWSTGAVTQTILVSEAGSYSVTVTDAAGCTGVDSVDVNVSTELNPQITGATSICAGDSTILAANGYSSYQWNTGDTTAMITVSAPGSYSVTVSDSGGCTGSGNVLLTVNALPDAVISGNTTLCEGDSVQLAAVTSANSFLWSTGDTSMVIVASSGGAYALTVTNDAGCSDTALVIVTEHPPPDPVISGVFTFCVGSGTTLGTGPFAAYQWSNGSTGASIEVSTAGIYAVTVTDDNGCQGSDAVTVEESSMLTPEIMGALEICQSASTTLSTGLFDSYMWSTGDTSSSILVEQPGVYSVTVSDDAGCTGSTSVEVSQVDELQPEISGQPFFCMGGQTILNTGAFEGYVWSTGDTTTAIVVTAPGLYSVTVTDAGGCSGQDTVTVEELLPPEPTLPSVVQACIGSEVVLDPGKFTAFVWSTGDTVQTIMVSESGLYTVTVTDEVGCSSSVETEVTFSDGLEPNITGELTFCTGQETILSIAAFAMISWSIGDTNTSVVVNTPGLYSVTVSDDAGCTGVDSVVVAESETLMPVISGNETLCQGSLSTLDAGQFDHYQWTTGDTTGSIEITSGGVYGVTVSDDAGCSGTAEISVTELPRPDVEITGQLSICTGGQTVLDAGTHAAYQWSTGAQTQTINVTAGGQYGVTVTDASGCTAMTSVTVEVASDLLPEITGILSICDGGSTTLDAGLFNEYLWSTGDTVRVITVVDPGVYAVTVSDPTGCTGADSVVVTFGGMLAPQITGAQAICPGQQITLSTGTYAAYSWSTGSQDAAIEITEGGVYGVTVTDDNGCTGTAAVTVQETPGPLANIVTTTGTVCHGESLMLTAEGEGTFTWSSTAMLELISPDMVILTPTQNTEVLLVAQNSCGADSATLEITVAESPVVDAGDDVILQTLDAIQLSATGAMSYLWNSDPSLSCLACADPVANPLQTTTYVVQGVSDEGCTAIDSLTIFVLIDIELDPVTAFTPNGDGVNETFVIRGLGPFKESRLTVFNRWGETVFEALGYSNDWDGTYKGQEVPAGTYLFVLTVDLFNETRTLKGTVTIIRE
ncbi:MAG: gliding motility-associated C-terminal domain-containing protein, partial [Saprospiraceae bacterium]|nr:gliding motility-associated C-terminal domain-containing protein [Saprospiraceae bacterium]